MEDDQWNTPPKRGSNERPRPGGGNSGPLPGQRPGNSRPANATNSGSFGRDTRSAASSQGPWRDDGWGQGQPRRSSGPINTSAAGGRSGNTSTPLSSGGPQRGGSGYASGDSGRRSGALGGQDQRGRTGGWEDDQGWQGQGNPRTSRSLTPAGGRPALGGRGPAGQPGSNQRGWDNDEEEWDSRPSRSPSGKQSAGGRPSQAGRGQPPLRKGTTQRGDWVVETDPKYKAPGNSLRVRLLFLVLAAVIALGAGVYFVPGAKNRILSFLPGAKSTASTTSGGAGTLTLQVNAPSAKITLDSKTTYTTTAGATAPFSSVAITGLTAGAHTITVHADNYTDFTGQLQMPATDTTMTAWLAPTSAQLTTLGGQFKPATAPDPGVAGDHYSTANVASGPLNISISYILTGLNPSPFTSLLAQSASTTSVPFKAATLGLSPDIVFTNAAGKLYEYKPQALPTTQFALQMPLALDAKGNIIFGAATVTLPSNVTANFTGPAKNDYALYFAIAAVLPTTTNALSFSCFGAVDSKNFNPEDGLQIISGDAHYFYRWGILWATNAAAHTLTPKAPQAQPSYNEFTDANTAHATGSCGS